MSKDVLSKKDQEKLAKELNDLLANYHVFYMNVRGFHWNIKGQDFFVLHEKFEELYDNLFEKIDEIAERILTIGECPVHSYSSYLSISEIKEETDVTTTNKTAESILDSLKILIQKQRAILDLSGDLEDEGTNALMSDYISEQEKLVWMYSAFLG